MRRKQMLNRAIHRTAQWRLTGHLWLTGERRGSGLKSRRGYVSRSIVLRPERKAGAVRFSLEGGNDAA
jgi:hypothetical protein